MRGRSFNKTHRSGAKTTIVTGILAFCLTVPTLPVTGGTTEDPPFEHDGHLLGSGTYFLPITASYGLQPEQFQGILTDVIRLPDWAPGHMLRVTGSSPTSYDLDVYFRKVGASTPYGISGCQSPATDPRCPVPAGSVDAIVVSNRGVDIDFHLEVSRPDCPGPPVDDPHYLAPEVGYRGTATVVAVIDTGINFFHDLHARPAHAGFGNVPLQAIDATTGQAARFLPIDRTLPFECNFWVNTAMQPRTLYRADGTNAFFYSLANGTVDGYDRSGHGSGVAGSVVEKGPDVFVVGVQNTGRSDFFAAAAEGITWAASQPWIDVISVSIVPSGDWQHPGPFLNATKAARDAGKLVFFATVNAASNNLHWTLPWLGDSTGPPWVVAVGAADPYQRGEVAIASKFPDVVGDAWGYVADSADYHEMYFTYGPSEATPSVAGSVAEGLQLARVAAGHTGPAVRDHLIETPDLIVTARDLREAMNRNAVYWSTTEWNPSRLVDPWGPYGLPDFVAIDFGPNLPINPVAPWLQTGWGYVNGSIAPGIAQTLLTGELPSKPPGAIVFMRTEEGVRESLWT